MKRKETGHWEGLDDSHLFDLILTDIGGLGRYQILLLLLSLVCSFLAAFNHLSPIYLAFSPRKVDCLNYNDAIIVNASIAQQPAECASGGRECDKWAYETDFFDSTVITQFDLVCGNNDLVPIIASSYMSGIVVTAVLMGLASDRFGRRTIIMGLSVVHIVSSFLTAFAGSFTTFVSARFFVGGSIHAVWSSYFILMTEILPESTRSLTGGVLNFGWNIGSLLMTLMAYFIRQWDHLQLAFACQALVLVLFFFLVPESPRWELAQGNVEASRRTLLNIARRNGVNAETTHFTTYFEVLVERSSKKERLTVGDKIRAVTEVAKNKEYLRRLLLMIPPWFAVGISSYGIHFSVQTVDFNIFGTAAIKEVIIFIAILVMIPIFQKLSRTACLVVLFIIGGLFGIGLLIIPEDAQIARVVVYMLAQGIIAADFFLIDTYTPEIFSTDVRNFTFSLLDAVSKVGTTVCPFVVYLSAVTGMKGLPPAIFGAIMITASLFLCFLPETKGSALAQTVNELEANGSLSLYHRIKLKLSTSESAV